MQLQALEIDNCIIFGVELVFVLSLSGRAARGHLRSESVEQPERGRVDNNGYRTR